MGYFLKQNLSTYTQHRKNCFQVLFQAIRPRSVWVGTAVLESFSPAARVTSIFIHHSRYEYTVCFFFNTACKNAPMLVPCHLSSKSWVGYNSTGCFLTTAKRTTNMNSNEFQVIFPQTRGYAVLKMVSRQKWPPQKRQVSRNLSLKRKKMGAQQFSRVLSLNQNKCQNGPKEAS